MQSSDGTLSSQPRSDSPTLGPWAEIQDRRETQSDMVVDLDFSQPPPSAALLAFATSRARMSSRPSDYASASTLRDDWSSDVERGVSPSSAYIVESPTGPSFSAPVATSFPKDAPARSTSEEDSVDSPFSTRSPTAATLPDPSQFPDPYPNRPPHWPSTPALSSADSSSTRSSAYTNSAKSGDYGHIHVALNGEDAQQAMGLSRDDVAQFLSKVDISPTTKARFTSDPTRWSGYAKSVSSRSSSSGNRKSEAPESIHGVLRATPSFDMGWRPDERDEAGLASEGETDDYLSLDEDENRDDDGASEEEPTSAMLVVEEGRGIIVRGEDTPIVRVQVHPGTTHLLIGSSSTPNSVPSFLATTLPQIASSLLALDISANFLGALPPALGLCVNLEELNIASNPLRALPVFLGGMVSLRVLIVDSTGTSSLPEALSALEKLHTLSIRRNKLHLLPSWLCLLPSLETLLVDGNPFLGPWKALMDPLLAQSPTTPMYPPSTPMFPLPSATASMQSTNTDADDTDIEDDRSSDREIHDSPAMMEDEDTITPALKSPPIQRSVTSPLPGAILIPPPPPKLARTRTTPNRSYFEKSRGSIKASGTASASTSRPQSSKGPQDERELRKMKSAGDLRRNTGVSRSATQSGTSSPQRGAMSAYVSSASSSNLLDMPSPMPMPSPVPGAAMPKRFVSLGVTSGAMASPASPSPRQRPQLDGSIWEQGASGLPLPPSDSPASEDNRPRRATLSKNFVEPLRSGSRPDSEFSREVQPPLPPLSGKTSRWGFLKKMSMGKMRVEGSQSMKAAVGGQPRPLARTASSPGIPQIDVRISTTGSLLRPGTGVGLPQETLPPSISRKLSSDSLTPPEVPEKPRLDMLTVPSPSSPHLLVPGAASSRAMKRRSFLPIDVAPIPIPSPTSFFPAVTASNEADDADDMDVEPPSPLPKDTAEEIQRREEERAREARLRALRSVMAYLRDMQDLGQSQANVLSMYGGAGLEAGGLRSRRPTIVDNGRMPSENSVSSAGSMVSSRPESSAPSSSQLRSAESRIALRSGASTVTNSVASNNSDGSTEERKFKDDKSKRTMIIREIVETERTYVKGLQELVDIYIAPASVPVNSIGGQKQETIVPASERKTVFQGLDALHIFHRDSFLPALQRVTAPLLGPATDPTVDRDPDGSLSLEIARKVAQTFVSQAAFMKMYSTYINNFDNSVQRIRLWTSDRPQTPSAASPSSSSAQLVGLGLSMTAVAGGVMPDQVSLSNAASPLSSSQRKRIKQYLKRCRMNPRHSQLNLEGYLLLPVQRIPRYRLLLEELIRSSPPMYDFGDDPLDRALAEISSIATSMNEGKRESESRRRLVAWQSRIRGKFPSPLVQPHRRLIMDGRLYLTRVIRKRSLAFEVIDAQGDASEVSVECLEPELTPRPLIGILCNDLLVLCRDSSDGQDPNSPVDLWAVLRMQTLPQPATIVHGNALRLVDNKAILYFDAPSTSDALTWYRAINLHIPASKA